MAFIHSASFLPSLLFFSSPVSSPVYLSLFPTSPVLFTLSSHLCPSNVPSLSSLIRFLSPCPSSPVSGSVLFLPLSYFPISLLQSLRDQNAKNQPVKLHLPNCSYLLSQPGYLLFKADASGKLGAQAGYFFDPIKGIWRWEVRGSGLV